MPTRRLAVALVQPQCENLSCISCRRRSSFCRAALTFLHAQAAAGLTPECGAYVTIVALLEVLLAARLRERSASRENPPGLRVCVGQVLDASDSIPLQLLRHRTHIVSLSGRAVPYRALPGQDLPSTRSNHWAGALVHKREFGHRAAC